MSVATTQTYTASGPSRSLRKQWQSSEIPAGPHNDAPSQQHPEHQPGEATPPSAGRIEASNPPTPSTAVVSASVSDGARGHPPAWYDAKLTNLQLAGTTHTQDASDAEGSSKKKRVTDVVASSKIISLEEEDAERTVGSLCTVGPAGSLKKSWSVQLPDTVVSALDITEIEESRERRRRHPDAPLHSTRARFARDIGLQEDESLADPDTGRSLLSGLDDTRRSYYGHPEDAAWIAFFMGVGRPTEDYGWLKSQVFVDEETESLVDPRLTEDSGAAATAIRATTSASIEVAASVLLAKWSMTTSPLRTSRGANARDELLSSYRLASTVKGKSAVRGDTMTDEGGASAPIYYASPSTVPQQVQEGTSFSGVAPVELFPDRDDPMEATPLVAANPSDTSVVTLSSSHGRPSPLGSYDSRRLAQLSSSMGGGGASKSDSLLLATTDVREDQQHFPPSAFVSLPITERYRPSMTSNNSCGGAHPNSAIAAMPPIRSGKEYRNQMRAKFLERKEKGVIAPATILSSAASPQTPSQRGSTSSNRDLSLLISPAARSILEGGIGQGTCELPA